MVNCLAEVVNRRYRRLKRELAKLQAEFKKRRVEYTLNWQLSPSHFWPIADKIQTFQSAVNELRQLRRMLNDIDRSQYIIPLNLAGLPQPPKGSKGWCVRFPLQPSDETCRTCSITNCNHYLGD